MTEKTESKSANMPTTKGPLSPEMLDRLNAYWRAANYLSVGQIVGGSPVGLRASCVSS